MKYGDTFGQRSIPEWSTYNIDYNEIKHLIKLRTSSSQGKSQTIAIPGQSDGNKAMEEFEGKLYQELSEQHQRIDLFVKSKSGEITRRLDHLHKQIETLGRQGQYAVQRRISVRQLERYAKVEGEVLRVGEEIQSLVRFVGAQRLAIQKLLKKYKKWTGSSSLGLRFHREVFGRATSFSQKDFMPQLSQWTEVLANVRAPFDAGLTWQPKHPKLDKDNSPAFAQYPAIDPVKQHENFPPPLHEACSSASELQIIYTKGSDVDVDTALATLPLGSLAGKTAYWIHPDNLIETHILLLQYMRLRRRRDSSAASLCASPNSSRRDSTHGSLSGHEFGTKDEIGTIVCDDLQSFAERHNGATIDDIESRPGSIPEEAAASIRYLSTGEFTVVVGTANTKKSLRPKLNTGSIRKAKMKRKALRRLFEFDTSSTASQPTSPESPMDVEASNADWTTPQAYNGVQEWFQDHQDVKPLVHLQRRRTRFVGLANNEESGVWATLDTDISMKKSSQEDLITFTIPSARNGQGSIQFPYGVLEVRWEGKAGRDLVCALDDSHLTERVRGFSLETHAVSTLCKPEDMPTPFWLPALEHDIRKVPSKTSVSDRQSSNNQHSTGSAGTPTGSMSTASAVDGGTGSGFSAATMPESPATSVLDQLETPPPKTSKKKRRARNKHPLHQQLSLSEDPQPRYWNEFDDGDEAPEEEAYTVLIDPNAPSTIPGAQTLSNVAGFVWAKAKSSSNRARAWLHLPSEAPSKNNTSAFDDYFSQRPTTEASSLITSPFSNNYITSHNARHYLTFPSFPSTPGSGSGSISKAVRDRENLLFWCCIASFLASFLLLLVPGVLASTRRHRYVFTADLGGVVGMVSSVVFSILGVGMMAGRREDVGWLHRWSVIGTAGILGVGNILLAVSVWDS